MSHHMISPQAVLADREYHRIDDFCGRNCGIEHLALIADFLQREFSLSLVLDPQIVEGFASDSSNLPARADALCRPESERQAAVILRAGRAAGRPASQSRSFLPRASSSRAKSPPAEPAAAWACRTRVR